jgi:hypothetical protein
VSLLKRESNHVGRPSNEELKQKTNKKIIIGVVAVVVLGIISGGVYLLVSGTNLFGLMGNSVTKSVKVCANGYKYNKKPEGCRQPNTYNTRPLTNLKVSSSSYQLVGIYSYNVGEYELYVGTEYNKKYHALINESLYSDSLSVELYEIKNGKYVKIGTMPFGSYKKIKINANQNKTYVSRLVITDAVTGKKVYAPYSNKVTLSANKIYAKPELEVVLSEYKNGYYETDIGIKQDKVKINVEDGSPGTEKFYFELYEVVNGKNVYVGKASVFNQGVIVKIRPRAKKQYKARFVFDFGSKKIYSNYSNILKVSK